MTVTVPRYRPDRRVVLYWAAILNAELLVLLAYFAFVTGPPRRPGFVLLATYPFVWLNVSWWAYRGTDVPVATGRRRAVAGGLAVGYFLVLAYVGGLLQPGLGDLATGLRVVLVDVPPGFAPAVLYSGKAVVVNVVPYQVVGYLALAYLVYVTAVDVSGSVAGGMVGLFSCVSCTFPVIATLISGVTGSAALAATASQQSYGLSTAVFVVTVLLLRWRPDAVDLARVRGALARR